MQAVRSLPSNFNASEQEKIFREVSPKLYGKLRPLFVVISDDMVKRSRSKGSSTAPSSGTPPSTSSKSAKGSSGSGSRGKGSSGSGGKSGRGHKRPPSPIPGGNEKHSK